MKLTTTITALFLLAILELVMLAKAWGRGDELSAWSAVVLLLITVAWLVVNLWKAEAPE